MTPTEVKEVLKTVRGAGSAVVNGKSVKVENGTRVHIQYKRIPGAAVTAQAQTSAKRAEELGLPSDRYTGRVSRVWQSKAGDTLLTVFVELERDHEYRCFNVDKGDIVRLVVLGD